MSNNLLNPQTIANAASLMDSLANDLNREIIVINEVANSVVIDPDAVNPMSDNKNPTVTYTANQTKIGARVRYIDKADKETELIFNGHGDSKAVSTALRQDYGVIRIKVATQYTDLVNNSTKLIIDGYDCQLLFNYTPNTLIYLSPNYTTFYVSRQK